MGAEKTFFYKLHTGTLLLLMLAVSGVTAVCVHPFVSVISYITGTLSFLCYGKKEEWCALLRFTAPISFFLILFNLLFNRNGITILFFIGNVAVTLESILYAFFSALSFSAVTFWFSFYCMFLDADRIFLWCSGFSKNFAILFSLSMSLVPKTLKKYAEIKSTAKETEKEKEKFKNMILHISTLFSWVLEDSFETALSMKARGALLKKTKIKKRSKPDFLNYLLSFFSCLILCLPMLFSVLKLKIYPIFCLQSYFSIPSLLPYSLLTILFFLPIFFKLWEAYKWNSIK